MPDQATRYASVLLLEDLYVVSVCSHGIIKLSLEQEALICCVVFFVLQKCCHVKH